MARPLTVRCVREMRLQAGAAERKEHFQRFRDVPGGAKCRSCGIRGQYGTGKKHTNAFGNCVSKTAKAAAAEQQAATVNAASVLDGAEADPQPSRPSTAPTRTSLTSASACRAPSSTRGRNVTSAAGRRALLRRLPSALGQPGRVELRRKTRYPRERVDQRAVDVEQDVAAGPRSSAAVALVPSSSSST